MTMFGSQWLANAGASYEIDQSIRFNDNDAAYMSRTSATPTSTTIFTISLWFKRSLLTSGYPTLINEYSGNSDAAYLIMRLQPDDTINVSGYATNWRTTTRVFRDPSAWYHFVLAVDTNQGTAANRIKLYINGVEETSFSANSNPGSGTTLGFNTGGAQNIGRINPSIGGTNYFDGYMAEFNFIDGLALAPTSFGETNDDGVWIAKAYDAAYGDNGFYITGATAGDLGEDFSGNNNDFTSSGLAAASQGADSPTLNYCTLTPLSIAAFTGTFSEGNLRLAVTANDMQFGTMFPQTGKWFFEVYVTDANNSYLGIVPETNANGEGNSLGYRNGAMLNTAGDIYIPSGAATEDGSPSWGDGVRVGVAYDVDNHLVWWSIDGQWYSANDSSDAAIAITEVEAGNQGYDFSGLGGNSFAPCIAASTTGGDCTLNTGNPTASFIDTTSNSDGNGYGLFADPVPSGFLALNTANLPTPTIADGSANFQTTLYTATGSALEVNQVGNSTFQPDFVWVKNRTQASGQMINDAITGPQKFLRADNTNAQTTETQGLVSFDADGFSVGTNGDFNYGTDSFVGWQWLAGNGTASNEDGSINTTATSVNTAAGISISTYTGTGSNATFGHGLGAVPKMMIAKKLDSATHWVVYHQDLTNATYWVALNLTNAQGVEATHWNSTAPTSTVVNLGTNSNTNGSSAPYILYAFAEVEGFSRFGVYTGNGNADGSFIYTGFSPAFVMIRSISNANSWTMYDTTRQTFNPNGRYLLADTNGAEVASTTVEIDMLSNGFKARDNQNNINGSGRTYIYMAFAENPFGGDGVAPATAR